MTIQTDLYDEMLENIITLTNRPDLEGETKLALQSATTNAHLTDVYPRDVTSVQVQLPNGANQLALDTPTLFPRIRGISTVRPLDVNQQVISGDRCNQIEVVELGDIRDPEYGNIRNNIAYMSGDKLIIRAPIQGWGFLVDYVQAPQTRREQYSSWVAQLAPSIIWYWAAALVFSTNGNEEKARNYLSQVEKFYIPQLKSNFLITQSR